MKKFLFVILTGCILMTTMSFNISDTQNGSKKRKFHTKEESIHSNCCCGWTLTREADNTGKLYRVLKCINHSYEDVVHVELLYRYRYHNENYWHSAVRYVDYLKPRSECVVASSLVEDNIEYECIRIDCLPMN